MARKYQITKSLEMTDVIVTVYNKELKQMEPYSFTLDGIYTLPNDYDSIIAMAYKKGIKAMDVEAVNDVSKCVGMTDAEFMEYADLFDGTYEEFVKAHRNDLKREVKGVLIDMTCYDRKTKKMVEFENETLGRKYRGMNEEQLVDALNKEENGDMMVVDVTITESDYSELWWIENEKFLALGTPLDPVTRQPLKK